MTDSILILLGSLRSESTNRQLAEAAVEQAPEGAEVSIFDGLAELPFYNEDIDTPDSVPEAAQRYRAAVSAADAILLVTPEYNGTIPAVLKNAIDWGSRPFGASPLSGKPAAVIGSAFGQYGGVWAHDDARKSVGIAGAKVLADVTLSIPQSLTRFAETHPRDDEEVGGQLASVMAQLVAQSETSEAA